ncbi:hypothetical protein KOR42_36280 [Thalassoglobus neptunius]|uniref:Uncharacterized protein n=1 Tax=Thalassoglobus neptunius TaxID=1938619 RepID=A0A5C5WJQ8_9PLAN|nr:hypothetical protein [Thalassoglobus neptunius]TWT50082.1 hypothetical protein KOR42_36280 [Thalassoglobus neptunius]
MALVTSGGTMSGFNSSSGDQDSNSFRATDRDGNDDFVKRLPKLNLLSQILSSADAQDVGSEETNQLRQEFQELRNRLGENRSFDKEVAAQMVEVVTSKIEGLEAPLSEKLVDWVAETLCEDPVSRRRLEQIWSDLTGQ